jgi:hypothetical protein
VNFHRIETGLLVLPTVTGERVLLEITPKISGFAKNAERRSAIPYTEASTRLSVPFEKWISIGGSGREGNEALRAVLEAGDSDRHQSQELWIMVQKEAGE